MSTKIIENKIETTDYDIAGFLHYNKINITYQKFTGENAKGFQKEKIKMIAKVDDPNKFLEDWNTGKLKVDPKQYGQSIRAIREATQSKLDPRGGSYAK